jgi:GNAT superfamily N-acetyltransferase
MSQATWISPSSLPDYRCPYCGHEVDPATDWVVDAQQAWGRVGVAISEGDDTTGLLLLAPVERQAAMVMCLWVAPDHVQRGYGRRLVQAGAAGLLARDVRSMAARGSRTKRHCATPPADFLRAVGFVRGLDDPLYRLDLDQTVVERPTTLFELLERWVGSIRPIGPEPVGRVTRNG